VKARTKAARRRGRPRLPVEPRQANGRKSRRIASQQAHDANTERDAMNTAVQARIRHNDIRGKSAEVVALDPRFGFELGRLLIFGKITRDQFDAGQRYSEDMARYYGLSGVAFPSARAQNLFAVAGEAGESEDRAERAAKATAKAKRLHGLLLAIGGIQEGRDTLRIVQAVCVSDEPLGKSERALFLLRRGLNRLAKYYSGDA